MQPLDTRKQVFCNFFMRGICTKGESCPFSHDPYALHFFGSAMGPSRPSSHIDCVYWQQGYCKNGSSCAFKHDQSTFNITPGNPPPPQQQMHQMNPMNQMTSMNPMVMSAPMISPQQLAGNSFHQPANTSHFTPHMPQFHHHHHQAMQQPSMHTVQAPHIGQHIIQQQPPPPLAVSPAKPAPPLPPTQSKKPDKKGDQPQKQKIVAVPVATKTGAVVGAKRKHGTPVTIVDDDIDGAAARTTNTTTATVPTRLKGRLGPVSDQEKKVFATSTAVNLKKSGTPSSNTTADVGAGTSSGNKQAKHGIGKRLSLVDTEKTVEMEIKQVSKKKKVPPTVTMPSDRNTVEDRGGNSVEAAVNRPLAARGNVAALLKSEPVLVAPKSIEEIRREKQKNRLRAGSSQTAATENNAQSRMSQQTTKKVETAVKGAQDTQMKKRIIINKSIAAAASIAADTDARRAGNTNGKGKKVVDEEAEKKAAELSYPSDLDDVDLPLGDEDDDFEAQMRALEEAL